MTDALQQLAEIPEALQQFQEPAAEPEKAAEPEAKPVEEVKADPLVEKARSSGWRPKEEFEGDPDQWVDAGEFVRRKPLFDQIHQLKKEVKSRAEQIEQVSQYAAKAAEKARQQLLEELESKKREAFQNADYDAFAQADAELKKAEAQPELVAEQKAPEIPQELQDFTTRNERWFDKDRAMTVYALAEAERLKAEGVPYGEMLKRVEQEVRREFAHKFTNPNKEKAAAVVPDGGEKVGKGKLTHNDLTRDERAVWNSVKNHMTFDEYIKDLR
jgi:regulator of replication initiation timing